MGHGGVESYFVALAAREEAPGRRRFVVKVEQAGIAVRLAVNFYLQRIEPRCSTSRMQHTKIDVFGIRRNVERNFITGPGRRVFWTTVLHVVKRERACSRFA